ncbi:enoyl-CoA hydratase/isomerase family protein [Aestuariibacter halophilus]|uniref:3-hydroxyisobutyryl-CoA hydrolase n=1 Tax=Fluctibacter halophilus TaxID=226011 RepID=A0ABS8G5R1_9ALTE|nr:enoyl-CoA hydratase/isomerase family protein [Aestuariibacter halophilus]MCC2615833.1 enoyl-CoA hydratase/isomerase family protein [Aestuariibacter halophilus]
MTDCVVFDEHSTVSGHRIAVATLNKPKALNALGSDMVALLLPQLRAWQQRDDVLMVVLDAEGDKAFCAGGDVVSMHRAMAEQPDQVPAELQDFFTQEYRLDHLIHTYNKPVLVWGNGIVMGGGLGLMAGASHRIVTESSRIAMPEITIGLYPDVGGSWFLNRMPGGSGLFLGLTGASINATDALYIRLADHFIPHACKQAFFDSLLSVEWAHASVDQQLTSICQQWHKEHSEALPAGQVEKHQAMIDRVTAGNTIGEVVSAILALDDQQDKWLQRAKGSLAAGSPVTMHLVWQQLQRAKSLSLAECFQMELIMSCRCGEFGEFQEGVRALLIDKDNNPQWHYANVEAVPEDVLARFFEAPWGNQPHPLAELKE